MSFVDMSCAEFVEALASKQPTPGGGGAAALVGAVGVALGNMVGSLTVGKEKYADVEEDIVELKKRADALQTRLLDLVDRDAEAFEPLSRAYSMPTETEDERAEKERVMEDCLRACCAVPLEIMKCCVKGITLLEELADIGTPLAISDVACGLYCCVAAMDSAGANIFINTKLMKDREYAKETNEKTLEILGKNKAKVHHLISAVNLKY